MTGTPEQIAEARKVQQSMIDLLADMSMRFAAKYGDTSPLVGISSMSLHYLRARFAYGVSHPEIEMDAEAWIDGADIFRGLVKTVPETINLLMRSPYNNNTIDQLIESNFALLDKLLYLGSQTGAPEEYRGGSFLRIMEASIPTSET